MKPESSSLYSRNREFNFQFCTLLGGDERREGVLLGDDEFLVLVGDVALDPAVIDEVGQDAGRLVVVYVLHLQQKIPVSLRAGQRAESREQR